MNNLVVISLQNFHNDNLYYLVDLGTYNPSIQIPKNTQKICVFYNVWADNIYSIIQGTTCTCLNQPNQLQQLLNNSSSSTIYRVTLYKSII